MNRKQLSWSTKREVASKVLDGEWSHGEAAASVGYSVKSLRRWVDRVLGERLAEGDPSGSGSERSEDVAEPQEEKVDRSPSCEPMRPVVATAASEVRGDGARQGLTEEQRRVLDDVLAQRPHLRRRSLEQYLERHHGLRLPRAVVGSYLRGRGLVGPSCGVELVKPARRFEAQAPLDLVQMDLFYVARRGGGFYYGLSVLDDHSRYVLGVPVVAQATGEAVLSAVRGVLEQYRVPRRVLTDRGPQFVSWRGRTAFQDYVEDELWATHVVAAPAHPQTLGKVERFHRSVRQEALTKAEGYDSVGEVQEALDRYVAWYNYVRPHQGLDGLTPADRFFGLAVPLRTAMQSASWRQARQEWYLGVNMGGHRLVVVGGPGLPSRILWDEALHGASVAVAVAASGGSSLGT